MATTTRLVARGQLRHAGLEPRPLHQQPRELARELVCPLGHSRVEGGHVPSRLWVENDTMNM